MENGCYVYKLLRNPMCASMKKFIAMLAALSSLEEMNQVLENFTILQVSLTFSPFGLRFRHACRQEYSD
ncbi:unnamed protein product [Dibothriocephalus latus]|uniref:YAP binding domain-containing protein n=1 Tax=Dibothriocephalus latus TaxID=60516 RepID=A0A3P6QIL7_DIBLA|nr:unnamed protein product [Dibothriocephalus latus]